MADNEVEPPEYIKGFLEELQNETPRSAVILAGAFLDAQLRDLLSKFLIDEKKDVDELLGSEEKPDRPLSSFGSRIRAAYCLGLISRMEYDDLKRIQKIRNKFAHKMRDYSFDESDIVKSCENLEFAKMMAGLMDNLPNTHEAMFMLSVTQLAIRIGMIIKNVEKDRRSMPPDPLIG